MPRSKKTFVQDTLNDTKVENNVAIPSLMPSTFKTPRKKAINTQTDTTSTMIITLEQTTTLDSTPLVSNEISTQVPSKRKPIKKTSIIETTADKTLTPKRKTTSKKIKNTPIPKHYPCLQHLNYLKSVDVNDGKTDYYATMNDQFKSNINANNYRTAPSINPLSFGNHLNKHTLQADTTTNQPVSNIDTVLKKTPVLETSSKLPLDIAPVLIHDSLFECGEGISLNINSPLPNVFCLSLRQKRVRSIDAVPRDLDTMREPLAFEDTGVAKIWTHNDIQLRLDSEGFSLIRQGVCIIKTGLQHDITGSGIVSHHLNDNNNTPHTLNSKAIQRDIEQPEGFSMTLNTAAMGIAHNWPISSPVLQGSIAVCGLYGGVGALAADGITCHREGDFTTISTQSPAIDIFWVAGTPIETTHHITLLAGRVVPPSIWAYGLGLAPTLQHERQSLKETVDDLLLLRAQGIPTDLVLPTDKIALDDHGRYALFTEDKTLEDMELHKYLTPIRQQKIKIIPQVSMSLKDADILASEWRLRGLMLEDANDIPSKKGLSSDSQHKHYLPNIHAGAVVSGLNDRLESVFKHGIDATQLIHNPYLESSKKDTAAWKKTLYTSSMRWHGEGVDRRVISFSKQTLPTKSGAIGVQIEADCSNFQSIQTWLQTLLVASHSGTVLLAPRFDLKNATPTVLKRLAPIIALMPMGWLSDTATLLSDDSKSNGVLQAWQMWMQYRLKLLPYIAGVVEESSRNGLPAMRSMRLAFSKDTQAGRFFNHQYLLGPALLVCPVLHDKPETTVWLPSGAKWYHLPTGTKFEGGQAIKMPVASDGICVFGREGHILCLGSEVQGATYINTIKPVTDAWLFGLPNIDPCVTGIRVKVMQMQGNAYIKGLEGTKIISTNDYTVSRRGAEVKVIKRR